MFVVTKNQAIAKADTLHTFLLEKGIRLPSSELLNAVARMAGYTDWNAFCALASEDAVNQILTKDEQFAAYDSTECSLRAEETGSHGFGAERFIQVASGFWLVTSAGDTTDYVRVCDPLGREVVYWTESEFAEDPTCVLGALARYLNRDRQDKMPNPLNRSADKIVVADRSIVSQTRKTAQPRTLSGTLNKGIQEVHLETTLKSHRAYVSSYALTSFDNEALIALDREIAGINTTTDTPEDYPDDEDIVIDWSDEFDSGGLTFGELKGVQPGPSNTWLLADGRVLSFYRLSVV